MIYATGNQLKVDVMRGLHLLYTVQLLELYDSERSLNGGRFKHFSHTSQEYKVRIVFPRQNGEELTHAFKERLEWIADQASEAWSFELLPEFVGKADIEFTFACPTTAVIFKLVWF